MPESWRYGQVEKKQSPGVDTQGLLVLALISSIIKNSSVVCFD
jgi:hypothetical protein